MKRFLCFAVLFLAALTASFAQQPMKEGFDTDTKAISGAVRDTVTNAATKYLYTAFVKGTPKYVEATFNITKLSGTLGGTLTFQGSHDGLVWDTVGSAHTVTDASQVKSFGVAENANGKRFFRGRWAGTGTMSGWMEATYSIHY